MPADLLTHLICAISYSSTVATAMSRASLGPVRPHHAKNWKDIYDDVYDVYWIQDRTLEDTMEIMKARHSFRATVGPILAVGPPLPPAPFRGCAP